MQGQTAAKTSWLVASLIPIGRT